MSRPRRSLPVALLIAALLAFTGSFAAAQADPPGVSAVCEDDGFDTLGSQWLTANLGDSDQGSAVVTGGRLQVSGDGTSLFHGDDHGFFAYQQMSGDFRVEVDILGFPVDQGGGYRKGGLMVRAGTAADSPRVMIQYIPHAPLAGGERTMLQFDYRDANGVANTMGSNLLDLSLPLRLAIDRRGETLNVYYSSDGGDNWVQPLGGSGGTIDIAMPDPVLAGLAVASYDANQEITVEFDDFRSCRPNTAPAQAQGAPRGCDGATGVDMVVALDLSGSMTSSYAGAGSRLAAAQDAIDQLTDDLAQSLPNSRVALITYSGGFTVADNLANGVTVESPLTTDLSAIDTLVAGFDAASINVDASTPMALAIAEANILLAAQHDGVRRPVVVLLTDGVPNVDGEGRGPWGYEIDEIQDISLRDDQGQFLAWPQVGWLGTFNRRHATYAAEPLAAAMYELETLAAAEPEVRIFGVALQGDGMGLGSFDEGLLEYGAYLSDALSFSAADTAGLLSEMDLLATELTCPSNLDVDPPVLQILAPTAAVTNDSTPQIVIGYTDATGLSRAHVDVMVDGIDIGPFCAVGPDQVVCESPELAPGPHQLDVGLRDVFDNLAEASLAFTLSFDDTTPPSVSITAPQAIVFTTEPATVVVSHSDASGIDPAAVRVTSNGTELTFDCLIGPDTTTCPLSSDLSTGTYEVIATVTDRAGNSASTSHVFELVARAPTVTIEMPVEGLVTDLTNVIVQGTVDAPVASVQINGVQAAVTGSGSGGYTFSAALDLVEGTNRIVATAVGLDDRTGAAAITVRKDTQAPRLVIESPRHGEILTADTVTVAGTVSDIIPGATVNADDVTVTLNGWPAAVDNRTFLVPDIPLAPGENVLVGQVTDRAGNTASASVTVHRQDALPGPHLEIVSGNNQMGVIHSDLPQPFVVRLVDPQGQPLAHRQVDWRVSRGDGLLGDPADERRDVSVLTAADGTASLDVRLGSRSGEGFHRVLVSAPGVITPVEFCATAQATAAASINITMDPAPRGIAGQLLSDRLSVIVRDAGGNPVVNEAVTFEVERGGGRLTDGQSAGGPLAVVNTNADGIAEVEWTLGNQPGTDNQRVSATFDGYTGLPAVFVVSAIELGPPAATSIRGVVQDSLGLPIVGARAEVVGTGLEAFTGVDGVFEVLAVPPGGHHVVVHGSTADDPAANRFFPNLEFAVEAISGHSNDLGQEVILPFINMAGAKLVGGNEDVVLEMDGVEGFAIKIFANSVILPDGSHGELLMSSSQVKIDKVPMAPPQGSTPFVVGTLQPGGIHFDPPAQVIYPNVAELSAGDVADVFAFHHDIGQFVNIGPGTVSEDATVVASDPGFGIVQSGWHCLIRQPGPTGGCKNHPCEAEITWSPLDGSGAPMGGNENEEIELFAAAGAGGTKARVTVQFTAKAGLQGNWTSEGPVTILEPDPADGLFAIIGATGPGMGRVYSPSYRFEVDGNPDASCTAAPKVVVKNLQLDVAEVSFLDDYTLHLDQLDQAATLIEDPVWKVDGGQDNSDNAVAYPHQKHIKVAAKFKVDSDIEDPPTSVQVRATGPANFEIEATDVTYEASSQMFVLSGTMSTNPLPPGTAYHPSMTIDWEFSLNGEDFASAGSSTHKMYVTLGNSTSRAAKTYVTAVDLAVAGGGAMSPETAFNNTWAEFSSGGGPANVTNWNGDPLQYYPTDSVLFGAENACSPDEAGLLWTGRAQCGALAQLMKSALDLNGIDAEVATAKALPFNGGKREYLLVNNWSIPPTGQLGGTHPYRFRLDETIGPGGSNFGMVPAPPGGFGELGNSGGVAGQHSTTPSQKFFDKHLFLKVGGIVLNSGPYFDPSYGLSYQDAFDFEAQAVAAYVLRFPDDTPIEVGGRTITLYRARPAANLSNIELQP